MSPPALSRGPPRSPASGLQPAGAQLSMLGTYSGNFSPNSAPEFLTLPTRLVRLFRVCWADLLSPSMEKAFLWVAGEMSPSLASLVCGGLLELQPNLPPGGFTPARATVWSSLGALRWWPGSSPVPGQSCCLPGAFWETLGPCREPGGTLPRRCVYGGLTQRGAPLLWAVYRGHQLGWWVGLSSRVSRSPYCVRDAAE